ncbi:MAG: sucrose phosphorylase [Acidimicrobiales bacterium]
MSVQLITYPDSLGGDLASLDKLLAAEIAHYVPGGVHILPPFPSSGDRGFAPTGYDQIEPSFGTWSDISSIASTVPVTLDIMVNHLSRLSTEFQDFLKHGRASVYTDMFIFPEQFWPNGVSDEDVEKIFLRKPDHPFSTYTTAAGEDETVWTTFGSEQIDLDVSSQVSWDAYRRWFSTLAEHGVSGVRLDAVGYLTKAAGTACFMNRPAIWELLTSLEELARSAGLELLTEVHDGASTHRELAEMGYLSYDFAFPGLMVHAIATGRADLLREHLSLAPTTQVTMLDCHDGIPVCPDLDEVLDAAGQRELTTFCVDNGANINVLLNDDDSAGDEVRAHQLNITYRSAVGSDDAMVMARAIQLFAPGTPQVYYVGLLNGLSVERHPDLDGRDVNRHNYSVDEVMVALRSKTTQAQLRLMELRNTHPAFNGTLEVSGSDSELTLAWTLEGSSCRLDADLKSQRLRVVATASDGTAETVIEI